MFGKKIYSIIIFTAIFASIVLFFAIDVLAENKPEVLNDWQIEFSENIIESVNFQRINQGLGELRKNDSLQTAAQQKAEDMAQKGYFSHTTPDGKDPWHWIEKNKIGYELAGENLAAKFNKPEDVVVGWMNSPGHKKNVLNEKYSETGIGVAKGLYEGKEVIFVAEFYVKPSRRLSIGEFISRYL